MRFQVPQYIEVEDKIFGPLTFKQFVYVAGGLGLSFVFYYFLDSLFFSLIFIIPIMSFSGLLAFYQYNNKPFISLVESFIYYIFGDKLYIWKKVEKKKEIVIEAEKDPTDGLPKITSGSLHDLSLKLDMKEPEEKLSDRV